MTGVGELCAVMRSYEVDGNKIKTQTHQVPAYVDFHIIDENQYRKECKGEDDDQVPVTKENRREYGTDSDSDEGAGNVK